MFKLDYTHKVLYKVSVAPENKDVPAIFRRL